MGRLTKRVEHDHGDTSTALGELFDGGVLDARITDLEVDHQVDEAQCSEEGREQPRPTTTGTVDDEEEEDERADGCESARRLSTREID